MDHDAYRHGYEDCRNGRESLLELLVLAAEHNYAWDYQLGWLGAEIASLA